ncbi:MAG: LemA protein [Candidatus Woesearchaeota archaeon]|jgi:LemA protein
MVFIFIILAVIVIWVIAIYNGIIRLKNGVENSWSGIDVQLKRRSDLIPNLIKTVKGYAKHEKTLFENVAKLRTQMTQATDAQVLAGLNTQLLGQMKTIFGVAENYPDLKANKNYIKLQEELSQTENQIAASRRIYNENVTLYNTKIQVFPNNLFAKVAGINEKKWFRK